MHLLGVRVDSPTKAEALHKVSTFLGVEGQHMIFTPNPEMLISAVDNEYFRDILNSSALNICDGRGVQIFAKGKVSRIPGVDFVYDICELAESEGKSVYLLGSGSDKVIESAALKLKKIYPELKIAGFNKGPKFEIEYWNNLTRIIYNQHENDEVMGDIIQTAPDIVLVGFGHIKQEQWIDESLPQLPSVRVAMGVGGSFDVIGGKLPRAPKFLRTIGLEWLWRLIIQPSRIKRIWTAVIIFPYRCIFKPKSKFE